MQSFVLHTMIRHDGNVGNLRRSAGEFQIGKKQHNFGPDEQVAKQKYHGGFAGRQPVATAPTRCIHAEAKSGEPGPIPPPHSEASARHAHAVL